MEYRLMRAEDADLEALEELHSLVDRFSISVANVMEANNLPPPDEMTMVVDIMINLMDEEYPEWEGVRSMGVLTEIRLFDVTLGYAFKAAAIAGITGQIEKTIPAEIASDRNKDIYSKYELPSMAMAAKLA
ncbi:MAG: hypothetical protein HY370_04710 [Proteobacteria bacterium]|nr:hypothetical protein [Pseudomonadota bacterium]